MKLSELKFACQTYSWEMSLDLYRGRLAHMMGVAAASGFRGFEPETVMLGEAWTSARLDDELAGHSLELAALVLVCPWHGTTETGDERAQADAVIAAVAPHPEAKVVLVNTPGRDRGRLVERQRNAVSCMSAISTRAAEAGVRCTVHPNSPVGSVFRTAADYDTLHALMKDTELGFTPDIGHIAAGGMDPLTVVRDWRARIDHVHIKDISANGTWAATGDGVVDIVSVLNYLAETDFDGWVTFEDESPSAERDPDEATAKNGDYIRRLLETADKKGPA